MVDNPEKYELLVSKATYWSEIKFKVGLLCKVKSIFNFNLISKIFEICHLSY